MGTTLGVTKGDIRSLDYSSDVRPLLGHGCTRFVKALQADNSQVGNDLGHKQEIVQ